MRSMHISACTAGTPESSGFGRFMLPLRRNSLGTRSRLAFLLLGPVLGAAATPGPDDDASALLIRPSQEVCCSARDLPGSSFQLGMVPSTTCA